MGGEESGGICFKNHIPERDGILAGLLILEMLTVRGKSLESLVETLSLRHHPVAYLRIDKKDGVKFYLSSGAWMLMRLSDTEPKGRIYVGGPSKDIVQRTLNAGKRLLFQT